MRADTERVRQVGWGQGGFSLVELLAVIAIIAAVVGVIGFTFRGPTQSQALRSGQTILASMLTVARGQAAIQQAKSYFVVNVDAADEERYLRYATVIVELLDDEGNSHAPRRWISVTDGVFFPPGVFFVPHDVAGRGIAWTGEDSSAPSIAFSLGALIEPYASETGSGTVNWHGYAFSHFGTSANASLVLATGSTLPNPSGPPPFQIELLNPELVAGARMRQYGNFTLASSPEDFQ
jgi:prepilin-type N-terminal cleavage/methylation domain-containing protein